MGVFMCIYTRDNLSHGLFPILPICLQLKGGDQAGRQDVDEITGRAQAPMTLLCFVSSKKLLQLPKDASGQIAFQDSLDFPVAQPLGRTSFHVFLGAFVELHSVFDDDIQRHVQLPIAVPVETVSGRVSRGCLQGRNSSQGSECGFRAEPVMVRICGEDDSCRHWTEPGLGLDSRC